MGRTELTPRELEVLRLCAAGESSRGIARELGLAIGTIYTKRQLLREKLNVTNITAAVVMAMQEGLIDASEIEVLRRDPIDNPPHP